MIIYVDMKQMVFPPYPSPPNDESQAGKEKKMNVYHPVYRLYMNLHLELINPSATYLLSPRVSGGPC